MSRTVRLVLCSGAGEVLGALPEFTVPMPWWPEVEPVVRSARTEFGADVVVLRLLDAETDSSVMGGAVSYLAELLGPPPPSLAPSDLRVDDHPLRAPWARPGGVAATVEWAEAALARAGRPRSGPVVQVKSWNLSSIVRLPTPHGDVWCKSVPPFLAHESTIMAMVAAGEPSLVPPLLAADPPAGTVLLGDVAGEDQWEAPQPRLIDMVRRLVRLQASWAGRVGELLAAGLPDWRAAVFPGLVESLLRRPTVRDALNRDELAALDALAAGLPRRFDVLGRCGLPETLVHGDFHPGNWRGDGRDLVLLDWGDSGVGHPLLDLTAFLPRIGEDAHDRVRAAWIDAWRAELPGSDPATAAELIGPVAALRQALIYQRFLDSIEPSEHRYHDTDVPLWLRRALG